jgi:hypothetical protein
MFNGRVVRDISRFLLFWFKKQGIPMRQLYVRAPYENILHGRVTMMTSKNTGIILFDNGESARFNMMDGCDVGLGESDIDKAIKFSASIDIERPVADPSGRNPKCRVVAVLNGRNSEWAYVWAHETDYRAASDELVRVLEKIVSAQEEKERERERRLTAIREARSAIESLGRFRISKAHKFDEESAPRPAKLATGPMKLYDLISAINTERIKFSPSQKKGNDTLFMWFERETPDGWKRIEIAESERAQLFDAYDGEIEIGAIQSVLDRLSGQLATVCA